jgi:hypothetical protein
MQQDETIQFWNYEQKSLNWRKFKAARMRIATAMAKPKLSKQTNQNGKSNKPATGIKTGVAMKH